MSSIVSSQLAKSVQHGLSARSQQRSRPSGLTGTIHSSNNWKNIGMTLVACVYRRTGAGPVSRLSSVPSFRLRRSIDQQFRCDSVSTILRIRTVKTKGRVLPVVCAAEKVSEEEENKETTYPKEFIRARLIQFLCILVGYSCYYLTRNRYWKISEFFMA